MLYGNISYRTVARNMHFAFLIIFYISVNNTISGQFCERILILRVKLHQNYWVTIRGIIHI